MGERKGGAWWRRRGSQDHHGLGRDNKPVEVDAEVIDDGDEEPELNRRVRGLVISRRAALALPAVVAGLGLGSLLAAPTLAYADDRKMAVFDQWVESLKSEGDSAIQKSEYKVDSQMSNGQFHCHVRTSLYNKGTDDPVQWITIKDFYDNGTWVKQIGKDWRDVPKYKTQWQETDFWVSGGGLHHITSTETFFRVGTGIQAGWDFWIYIPYTGKIGVEVWPIYQGNYSTPIAYNKISPKSHPGRFITYSSAHEVGNLNVRFRDAWNPDQVSWYPWWAVSSWEDYGSSYPGQLWFNRPAPAASSFCLLPFGMPQMGLNFDWGSPDWTQLNTRLWSRWNYDGAQQWHLDKVDNGYFRLWPNVRYPDSNSNVPAWGTNTALDLNNNTANNGEIIHVLNWRNNDAQKWTIRPFRFTPKGEIEELKDWPKKWTRPVGRCVVGLYRDAACRQEISRITIPGTQSEIHCGGYFEPHVFSELDHAYYVKMIEAPEHFEIDGKAHPVAINENVDNLNIAMISLLPKKYRARFWRLKIGDAANGGKVGPDLYAWAGEGVKPPANPSRTGYTFNGWAPNKGWEALWKDMDFLAIWVPIPYKVTFRDGLKNRDITTKTFHFGQTVNKSDYPTPPNHENEGYRVNRWDKDAPFTMPAKNLVITVSYIRMYKVTYHVDGAVWKTVSRIDTGTTYKIPGEYLGQAKKPNCTPGIDGWYLDQARKQKAGSSVKVTKDIDLWAVNRATVRWYKGYGNANNGLGDYISGESVLYGHSAKAIANPAREGYSFTGWTPNKGWENVKRDVSIKANWRINKYKVTWRDGVTGKVYKTGEYNYDSVIPAKEYPNTDEHEGYRKDKWDKSWGFHMPAHNVVITMNYVRIYNVFYWVDGVRQDDLTDSRIDTGTDFTIPADKAKRAFKSGCKRFDGWYSDKARRNRVTRFKVTGDVNVYGVNKVEVTYKVVERDKIVTIHTVEKNWRDTITSTDGDTGTALQKAKDKYTSKVIEYADKWSTDKNGDHTFTRVTVGGNTSIYLRLNYSTVRWFCDGTDAAHMVDIYNQVPRGTWVGPDYGNSAARLARAKKPNCTPGWRGWYLDSDAPSLHPELSAGRATTFASRASDAKFVGKYLDVPVLNLYSANIATVSFARAAGSEPVPERDVEYYKRPSEDPANKITGSLSIPSSVIRRVDSTLPFKAYVTAYKPLGDGRWRTYKPDAWHANADCSDAKKTATTVVRDATFYAMWREVTTDGVVDNRA